MSISPNHSSAARQNGALSHGPVTPEGKTISSQNARKHGFLSSKLLTHEDQQAFDQLLACFIQEHNPASPTEHYYVSELADAQLRLGRIRDYSTFLHQQKLDAIAANHPNDPDSAAAQSFCDLAEQSTALRLCLRYETQLRRQFDKALDQLQKLRHALLTDAALLQTTVVNEMHKLLQDTRSTQQVPQNQQLPNEPIAPAPPPTPAPSIPRSAPCPCGSGRPYKRCCGHYAPPVLG